MQGFVELHRPLILRHARAVVRTHQEKIPLEDVAREIELELGQLAKEKGLDSTQIHSPDHFLRTIAKHAMGRAKRRRTLIDQLAAGDDLDALSTDLAALDSDLAALPAPPSPEGAAARDALEKLKDALSPRDALVAALLFEDDGTMDEVAEQLTMPMEEVAAARERVLSAAAAQGIAPTAPRDERRGNP
jgi:DNA-directed RNA polymerase specialized sigma24 family protein